METGGANKTTWLYRCSYRNRWTLETQASGSGSGCWDCLGPRIAAAMDMLRDGSGSAHLPPPLELQLMRNQPISGLEYLAVQNRKEGGTPRMMGIYPQEVR